jgi:hypothetical protein
MNSSTPGKEGLARIIIVGVVGLPIGWVLFMYPSSMPPKQYMSEQKSPELVHSIKKSQPVPFCFTANVRPESLSVIEGVSVH